MEQPEAVDAYLEARLVPPDAALDAAREAAAAAGLPAIEVTPLQGKLLQLLALSLGARRILEVGTLAGYSTIWLARALPAGGRLVTLELDPGYARVAREDVARAGLDAVVELREGDARATLADLEAERGEPFDLVFVDADKASTPHYYESALRLTRPGSLVVVDNVIRGGRIARPEGDGDPSVEGIRAFLDAVGADPRVDVTAIQTVGAKGHDGFALARVR